jgi:hypothetical protein
MASNVQMGTGFFKPGRPDSSDPLQLVDAGERALGGSVDHDGLGQGDGQSWDLGQGLRGRGVEIQGQPKDEPLRRRERALLTRVHGATHPGLRVRASTRDLTGSASAIADAEETPSAGDEDQQNRDETGEPSSHMCHSSKMNAGGRRYSTTSRPSPIAIDEQKNFSVPFFLGVMVSSAA